MSKHFKEWKIYRKMRGSMRERDEKYDGMKELYLF